MTVELNTLGSVIKTAYEAEADTNAFTDAEKTKLAGVEAAADVTDTANVTAAGALMDSEVTNLAAVKAFDPADYATAAQANATHTGDATGATALTLQPAAITGKGAVTVDGADLLLVTDVSASPQVLGQVTAQSIANLAPAVQGSAILSSDTSPLVTDGYVLTADGAGGAAWEAAAGGGLSNVVEDTTPQLGGFLDLNGQEIRAAATSDAVIQLADNAGTYALSIQDSDSAEVLSIDSDGTLVVGANASIPTFKAYKSGSVGYVDIAREGVGAVSLRLMANNSYAVIQHAAATQNGRITLDDTAIFFDCGASTFGSASGANTFVAFGNNDSTQRTNLLQADYNINRDRDGAHLRIKGGDGGATNRSGGNIYLTGGNNSGAGTVGLIIMDTLPTSDPGVSGALYKELDATTSPNTYFLKVSA